MSRLRSLLALSLSIQALGCVTDGPTVDAGRWDPAFATAGVGDHHAIPLVSHTGYPGSGEVNVSPSANDPGQPDQGLTVRGEFTLHGADPDRTYFIARKVDATPPVLDCASVAAWNPFLEWVDAVTPTSPPVFVILTTSPGGAGTAHFYGRFASALFTDGKLFSARFAILEDTNNSGAPDAGDTEAYVTDACVVVTVK